MLIAPELIVYWAAQQWLGARQIAKEMNTIDEGTPEELDVFSSLLTGIEIRWTTVHGYFVQMLAFGRRDDGRPHIWDRYGAVPPSNLKSRGERERWTKQLSLKYLYSEGYIELDSLRSMKEEDIMDRSKGDLLSKIFAILQTSWFTLGCITRHHRRLPLTELEVITLASAVLNGVLYILWWNKPQNVERRHYLTILAEPGPKPEPSDIEDSEEPSLRIRISEWYSSFTRDPFRFIRQLWSKPVSYIYSTLSTDTSDIGVESSKKWDTWTTFLFLLGPVQVEFGTIAGGTVDDITLSCNTQFFTYQTKSKLDYGLTFVFTATFGAIHFIAWNFAFPSRTELVLWRVSCLILLIDPAVSLTLWIVGMPLDIDCLGITGFIIPFFSIPLYIFARFCILILAFIVLRDPDPQIFVDIPWTCYIPHL